MAWSTRARPFLFCCCLLVATACGDSNEPSAANREIAVTVFVPSGGISVVDGSLPQLDWSLEYQVGCGDASRAMQLRKGPHPVVCRRQIALVVDDDDAARLVDDLRERVDEASRRTAAR